MLFKRRLQTKIPELVPFDKCDEEGRDRDAVLKQKGKEYADDKKNAKYPDLKVNDKVLLQQRKMCKTTTMYEHDPYEIVDVNGSQVTIKSGEGVCYKRNSSHVRKFEESDLPSGNEYIDNSEYSNEPNTNEQVIDNSLVVAEPRRSSRSTKGKAPERLDL
jgi:hypothetical protein